MSMKVQCVGCGEDCSHACGTWRGYPYHIACIPGPTKKRRDEAKPRRGFDCNNTPSPDGSDPSPF